MLKVSTSLMEIRYYEGILLRPKHDYLILILLQGSSLQGEKTFECRTCAKGVVDRIPVE